MAQSDYLIFGRVHAGDAGVHGLTIDACDRDMQFHQEMGTTLTAEDGSFRIAIARAGLEKMFDAAPEVTLMVRDATGERLAALDEGQVLRGGEQYQVDLKLDESILKSHRENARELKGSGGVISNGDFESIGMAWDELSMSRGGVAGFQRNAAYCPGPPIMRYPDLVDVARGVIRGNPEDLLRFNDMLETMRSAAPNDPEAQARLDFVSEIENRGEGEAYFEARLKEMSAAQSRLGAFGEGVIGEDTALPVMIAAAMMGGGNPRAMHANLGLVMHNFCEVGRLGPVISAARHVRDFGPGGLGRFDRAWTDYMDMWGPDDSPPIPQPGGVPQPGRDPDPWPDPWPPRPGGFPHRPDLEQWICTASVVRALRLIGFLGGGIYNITNVSPARACPGDTITITGVGFGATPGSVLFPTSSGGGMVSPLTWSDTQITVVVPPNADCGKLTLQILVGTVEVCGRFVSIYKHPVGSGHSFLGGQTRIKHMSFRPSTEGCLRPGQTAAFHWAVCNATDVNIVVRGPDGSELARVDPAAEVGSISFSVPNTDTRGQVTAEVSITGPCGSASETLTTEIEAPYNLNVDGMEVTQAIQYYRANQHLTNAAQQGPDNSLRLVTNKPALVRVYLRSGGDPGFDGGRLTGVTGTLTVQRRTGGVWNTVATLSPNNAPVTAQTTYTNHDQERSNINNSLNFLVPAATMTGLLRFIADVQSADACTTQSDSDQVDVVVNLTQTLNAAFITVGYNGPPAAGTGPNLNLPAPNLAVCTAETNWAMAAFPLSGTPTVRIAGTFTSNLPLNDPRTAPGACSANWGPTLAAVATAIAADTGAGTTQWVYYGLITGGIPVNVPGCNIGVTSGSLAGQPQTYAHEIGHQFGLPHAPCGNVGTPNAAYPNYVPYDTPVDPPGTTNFTMASIGEYGIDMTSGVPVVRPPTNTQDLMSYCGPTWVSIFTHNFLLNRPVLAPTAVPSGDAEGAIAAPAEPGPDFAGDEDQIKPRIYLLGGMDEDGNVSVERVSRLPARNVVTGGSRTGLMFELIGKEGEVLSSAPVYSYHQEGGCGCGGAGGGGHGHDDGPIPVLIAAMADDVAPGAALRIVNREDAAERWIRKQPEKKVQIDIAEAAIKGQSLRLAWKSTAEDADIWVRWSADKGESWSILTIGLSDAQAEIDISHLPAGELMFQVMAQDGFSVAMTETETLPHDGAPPEVAIQTPATETIPLGSDSILLRGVAFIDGKPAPEDAYQWVLQGEPVGKGGSETIIPRPKSGKYELELVVKSNFGDSSARKTVIID